MIIVHVYSVSLHVCSMQKQQTGISQIELLWHDLDLVHIELKSLYISVMHWKFWNTSNDSSMHFTDCLICVKMRKLLIYLYSFFFYPSCVNHKKNGWLKLLKYIDTSCVSEIWIIHDAVFKQRKFFEQR